MCRYQVDAHNIVPLWSASDKQEYGARTLRPKIEALLPKFLTEFPEVPPNTAPVLLPAPVDWDAVISSLEVDRTVGEVTGIVPGAAAAAATLSSFITQRLRHFASDRNDPNKNALSGLSPYVSPFPLCIFVTLWQVLAFRTNWRAALRNRREAQWRQPRRRAQLPGGEHRQARAVGQLLLVSAPPPPYYYPIPLT